jgi:hypothetical protein
VDEHWRLVPDSWQEALGSFTDDDAALIVEGGSSPDWPPSLAELARSVHAALPTSTPTEGVTDSLPAELRRGAKPKKVHEMEMLGSLVKRTAKCVGAECVVELGSGKGYVRAFALRLPCPKSGSDVPPWATVVWCSWHTRSPSCTSCKWSASRCSLR